MDLGHIKDKMEIWIRRFGLDFEVDIKESFFIPRYTFSLSNYTRTLRTWATISQVKNIFMTLDFIHSLIVFMVLI